MSFLAIDVDRYCICLLLNAWHVSRRTLYTDYKFTRKTALSMTKTKKKLYTECMVYIIMSFCVLKVVYMLVLCKIRWKARMTNQVYSTNLFLILFLAGCLCDLYVYVRSRNRKKKNNRTKIKWYAANLTLTHKCLRK